MSLAWPGAIQKRKGRPSVSASMLKKALTERALNAEIDHHLAGDDSAGNTRNGYGRKTVITVTGKLAIDAPRDWKASFDPQPIAS